MFLLLTEKTGGVSIITWGVSIITWAARKIKITICQQAISTFLLIFVSILPKMWLKLLGNLQNVYRLHRLI